MRLLDLWNSDRAIESKRLEQIIAFAGDGRFAENNETSREFREYLSRVSPDKLRAYCAECLGTEKFASAAFALQDIINEIGRRLGFAVRPGRYRGVSGEVGYDGLWTLQNDHVLVVEVKTSDAYRVSRHDRRVSQASDRGARYTERRLVMFDHRGPSGYGRARSRDSRVTSRVGDAAHQH